MISAIKAKELSNKSKDERLWDWLINWLDEAIINATISGTRGVYIWMDRSAYTGPIKPKCSPFPNSEVAMYVYKNHEDIENYLKDLRYSVAIDLSETDLTKNPPRPEFSLDIRW